MEKYILEIKGGDTLLFDLLTAQLMKGAETDVQKRTNI